jgi:hypothetical protein
MLSVDLIRTSRDTRDPTETVRLATPDQISLHGRLILDKRPTMPTARTATTADLEPLLDLFRASEVSSAVEPLDGARLVWRQTLDHDGVTVFVSESKARIVATCMLITAPNLLRSGHGHAFLENVVTHPAWPWPYRG